MLEVNNLSVAFELGRDSVAAITGMTFSMAEGERLALMGESGCGKTVLALTILGLLPRTARVGGTVRFRGLDLTTAANARTLRGGKIAVSWSNAGAFFDPVATIGSQIAEAYLIHHPGDGKNARDKVLALMERLNFPDPDRIYRSHPHQLSGGMSQRAMIAMSLVNDPALVIVDEPTRGLDDRNRDMAVETLLSVKSVAVLLITHDVELARALADSVMVMRGGSVLENAPRDMFFNGPAHPYSRDLLAAGMMEA